MKKRLSRISPLQLGIVFAVFYGLFTLVIFLPFGFLLALGSAFGFSADPAHGFPTGVLGATLGGFMAILMPLLQAVLGFVFGVIAAAIYNLVAGLTGGIEFTVTDAPES